MTTNDRNTIDTIKHKVTLVDVIAHFGGADLNGDGDTLSGWHKAHESKSKNSLHVDNAKGVWHCKNCWQGGDMFSWVGHLRRNGSYRDTDKTMFAEAMQEIADFAGVEIPEHDKAGAAERRSLEEIWQIAADFYHSELTDEHRAYFHKRGYTDETIAASKLGYAPQGPRTLLAHLVTVHKIDGEELVKSGLFVRRDNGALEDHFQGRLMFPYLVHGRVAYFIGRITDQSPKWEHDRGMKYKKLLVNNDKHPYVSEQVSNRYFYGEDSVKPGGDLLITEGVADCLSALQAGFSCVSPVTVRFAKKDHAKILEFAEQAGTVYICNDNEASNAGGDGTLATSEMLWHNGKVAKIVTLPRPAGVDKVDLNDFLSNPEQGPEALKKLMASAKTLLDLKVEEYAKAQSDNAQIAAQSAVVDLVACIKDKFQLELWKRKLPKQIGMSTAVFGDMLKDAQKQQAEAEGQERAVASEVIDKGSLWVEALRATPYTFALNALEDTVEINGRRLDDVTRSKIYLDMVGKGVSKNYVDDCINVLAGANAYHPVQRYLNGLQWNGGDQLDCLLSHIQGDGRTVVCADDNARPLHGLLISRWLLGCVARALDGDKETAFKHQTPMLVFVGGQGAGKSSFVRWLCSGIGYEFHQEGPINPLKIEDQRSMVTKWLWEVSELGASLRRSDREAVKAFITQEWHTYRKPWGRSNITKPTLCNLVGSINGETGFLDDPTGHRRFLPVQITGIDWSYSQAVDVNQLWAQLVHLYRNGSSPELTPAERAELAKVHREHEIENPLLTYLQMYFTITPGLGQCFTATILQRLQSFGINLSSNPKVAGREINDVLAPLGLTRKLLSIDGIKGWGWVGIQPNKLQAPTLRGLGRE